MFFFVGTSHMEFSISPMKLYEDYGIVTYNASTSMQPIEVTNFLVHYIFDRGQKPKVIAMDASSLFLKSNEAGVRYVSDNVGISKNKIQLIYNYFANNNNKCFSLDAYKKALGFILPLYKYHTRWEELNYGDFFPNITQNYFLQGFYACSTINASMMPVEDVDVIASQVIENQISEERIIANRDNKENELSYSKDKTYIDDALDYNVQILEEISKTCKDHGCQLILLKNPVNTSAGTYSATWSNVRHDNIQKIATKLGVVFIDLNYDSNLVIDWNHDTRDGGCHLNYLGALKVTDYVGEILRDKFAIMPRKEYEYEKKIEKYNKYIEFAEIQAKYDFKDYAKSVRESRHNLIIFISANDDMRAGLNTSDIEALKYLDLKTDFNNMNYRDSFIAVVSSEEGVIYEKMSSRKQIYTLSLDDEDVIISSGGFLDGCSSSICIDGEEKSLNGRGINIVIVDAESGLVIDRSYCDTCDHKHEVIHARDEMLLVEYQNFLLKRK